MAVQMELPKECCSEKLSVVMKAKSMVEMLETMTVVHLVASME